MSTIARAFLVTIACGAAAMITILLVDRVSIKKDIALWEAEHRAQRKRDRR